MFTHALHLILLLRSRHPASASFLLIHSVFYPATIASAMRQRRREEEARVCMCKLPKILSFPSLLFLWAPCAMRCNYPPNVVPLPFFPTPLFSLSVIRNSVPLYTQAHMQMHKAEAQNHHRCKRMKMITSSSRFMIIMIMGRWWCLTSSGSACCKNPISVMGRKASADLFIPIRFFPPSSLPLMPLCVWLRVSHGFLQPAEAVAA